MEGFSHCIWSLFLKFLESGPQINTVHGMLVQCWYSCMTKYGMDDTRYYPMQCTKREAFSEWDTLKQMKV